MVRFFTVLVFLGLNVAAQASTPANESTITLERTGCLGKCPGYKVTIRADGSVLYDGRIYLHAKGIRKSRIKAAAAKNLTQEFEDDGFFDLPNSYGVCNDMPGVVVSLSLNGRYKQTRVGCGEPAELRKLTDEIERASGSRRWVRGRLRLFLHWPWLQL